MLNMKKFIGILLAAIMAFYGVCASAAEEYDSELVWGDDFESWGIGEAPFAYDDFYNSTAQKRPNDWTTVTTGVTVHRESKLTENKVARFYNENEGNATLGVSKATNLEAGRGNTNFELLFRFKPEGSKSYVNFQRFGGTGGTSTVFNAENGNVYCMGNYVTGIEMDKWTNVVIRIIRDTETVELYLDNEKVYFGPLSAAYLDATLYNIHFRSVLAKGKESIWDDFKIRNIEISSEEGSTEEANNLEQYKNVHPRLFYTADDFEEMRRKAANGYSEELEGLKEKADKLVERGVKEYFVDTNIEDLWMREEGDYIRLLSFAYKMTDDERYKNMAAAMVQEAIKYPSWGRGTAYENKNLACSHLLVGISCYYDWLYDELTENEKYEAKNIIIERASILSKGGWWSKSYTMNHCWNGAAGSLTAAMAVYDEYPQALQWAKAAHNWYINIFKYLGDDGACHEGMMYWNYGLTFMKLYLQLAPKFYNIDYSGTGYVQNTAKYAEAMILPQTVNGDNFTTFQLSDFSNNFNEETVQTLIFLNSMRQNETDKQVTQWYINKYYELFTPKTMASEEVFYYYDKNAPSLNPNETVPTDVLFNDLGLFFMRTKWQDNETAIVYRCGPALGEKCRIGATGYDLGTGHVHNDVNSFQIFTRGEHLMAEDSYGGAKTASHNTLLVNDQGQWPDNGFSAVAPYGVDANPHILKTQSADGITYSVADASEIYNPETGLIKFQRHFIYLKPDIMIVVDDIETAEKEGGTPLELRFFPVNQNGNEDLDGAYNFENTNSNFKIKPIVTAEGVNSEFTSVMKKIGSGTSANQKVVRITSNNSKLIQPTVFSWSDKDETPEDVTLEIKDDGKYYFYTNDEIITLDIKGMEVSRKQIEADIKLKRDGYLIDLQNEIENKGDRMYIALEDIETASGFIKGTYNEITGEISLKGANSSAVMKIGENTIDTKTGTVTVGAAPYLNGETVMLPVRFVGQCFGIDCEWEENLQTLKLKTGVDFSDASVKNISISGFGVKIEEGVFDYSIKMFAPEKKFNVLTSVSSASYECYPCEDLFGVNKIVVTSSDKTKQNIYYVTTEPFYGIGDTAVYDMGYSSCDGNLGENVMDGNFETRWSAAGDGQFLWYDLGTPKKIESMLVAYYSGDKRKGYFDIQVSDDGENWRTVKECVSSGATNKEEVYDLGGIETRFIRFYGHGTSASGGGWNSVTEIGIKTAKD